MTNIDVTMIAVPNVTITLNMPPTRRRSDAEHRGGADGAGAEDAPRTPGADQGGQWAGSLR